MIKKEVKNLRWILIILIVFSIILIDIDLVLSQEDSEEIIPNKEIRFGGGSAKSPTSTAESNLQKIKYNKVRKSVKSFIDPQIEDLLNNVTETEVLINLN